jgi:predicted RNase H-like HicB family nuclease
MAAQRSPAKKKILSLKPKTKNRVGKVKVIQCLPLVVPISTFAPEPFAVVKDFGVVVQPADASFVATLFDANIGASGETPEDAVQNLKDCLLNAFTVLEARERELGLEPRRQLAVLRSLICRRPS